MNAPLTGFEDHGDWSTPGEADVLLSRTRDETDADVEVVGTSLAGNALWRAVFGNPAGGTLFIMGGVHGNEPSGREACLALVRDLAWDPSPEQVAFLNSHRVVVIPVANPDGAELPRKRANHQGVNINRDFTQLTMPESRLIARAVRDFDPAFMLDLHEMNPQAIDYKYREALYANQANSVGDLGVAATVAASDAVAGLGHSTERYMPSSWGTFLQFSAGHGIPGMLSEIGMHLTVADRMGIAALVVDTVLGWFASNSGDCVTARDSYRASEATNSDPIPIPDGGNVTQPLTTVAPGVYTVDGWLPPELLELHGITADGQDVSTSQSARQIVAALFDPLSSEYVIGNPWWVEPAPRPSSGVDMWVKRGGVLREVETAWVKRGGVLRRVG